MIISKDLKELQEQADAFQEHCVRHRIQDRLDFRVWLCEKLSSEQLASLIDGEVTRQAIFEVYLNDKY